MSLPGGRGIPIVYPSGAGEPQLSVRLHRWGNSVGLRLPKALLGQLGLAEGSEVEVSVERNRLVIQPARRRRYTMAELLEGFTPDDRPEEVDWGPPVGREVW